MDNMNTATTATYLATRKASKQLRNAIRQQFPEAYYVAGTGWCGPDWQAAAVLEQELRARAS